jgi:DNA-binding CsgD family transcriptional regulator
MEALRAGSIFDPAIGTALLEVAESPQFPMRLLDAAFSVGGIEEIFVYRVGSGSAPQPLLSTGDLSDLSKRTESYMSRFYRHDPVWTLRTATRRPGGFAVRVGASDIGNMEYRNLCFDQPGFAEKLCFGWCCVGYSTVLSFYRRRVGVLTETAGLNTLANFALMLLARRFPTPNLNQKAATEIVAVKDDLVSILERRLTEKFQDLSIRERQICARTLSGRTAEQIAQELSIKPSTVLTYRQRAYGRLGYSRANDFLIKILS